jgi:hypothetical protein
MSGLMPMPTEQILRAKIRDLMIAGMLPQVQADGCLVDVSGLAVAGERHVGPADRSACVVCGDSGPRVSYQAPHDIVLHLHVKCDLLWQEERRPHPRQT